MAEARSLHGCGRAADAQTVPGACGCRVSSLSHYRVWRGAACSLAVGYWGEILSLQTFILLTCLFLALTEHTEESRLHGMAIQSMLSSLCLSKLWSVMAMICCRTLSMLDLAGAWACSTGLGITTQGVGGCYRKGVSMSDRARWTLNQEPPSLESLHRHSQLL